ncbi:hypothetical protein FACS189437_05940 [Bacteroidia bacterium]|nr:hypothetical protein FACS189437_05940 [Bacteroidia bacterium]
MKYMYLAVALLVLGGCVVSPPVKEEIIEKPDGQVIEKDVVEEPVAEPVFDPFFEPVIIGGPVVDVGVRGGRIERAGGFRGHR